MTRYVATVEFVLEADKMHNAALDLDDALHSARAHGGVVQEATVRELQQRRRLKMGDGKLHFKVRDPDGELRPVQPGGEDP